MVTGNRRLNMETKKISQEFEGCIDSVDLEEKTFWATLFDVTKPRYDLEETAEFDFSVFNVNDYKYIKEGYLFDWVIGEIVDQHNIPIRSFSEFSFQKRTRKEQATGRKKLVKAKKEAKRMVKVIENLFD